MIGCTRRDVRGGQVGQANQEFGEGGRPVAEGVEHLWTTADLAAALLHGTRLPGEPTDRRRFRKNPDTYLRGLEDKLRLSRLQT